MVELRKTARPGPEIYDPQPVIRLLQSTNTVRSFVGLLCLGATFYDPGAPAGM